MKSLIILSSVLASSALIPVPLPPVVPIIPSIPAIPLIPPTCITAVSCFVAIPPNGAGACANACLGVNQTCQPACNLGFVPTNNTAVTCLNITAVGATVALPPVVSGDFTCVAGCAVTCDSVGTGNNGGSFCGTAPSPRTIGLGDTVGCFNGGFVRNANVLNNNIWWPVQQTITCTAGTPVIDYACGRRTSSSKKGLLGLLGLLGIIPLLLCCLLLLSLLGCCKRSTRSGGDTMIANFDPAIGPEVCAAPIGCAPTAANGLCSVYP